jgi:hypothetical protein
MLKSNVSGRGSESVAESSGAGEKTADKDPVRAADLTKELAVLLAAAGLAGPQGEAGDSALLALPPSNSQSPARALALTQPDSSDDRQTPPREMLAPLAPAGSIDTDEEMPIPSTWHQPFDTGEDEWFGDQLRAGLIGLGVGLMIIVPSVLWLNGWFSGLDRFRSIVVPAATTSASVASTSHEASERAPRVEIAAVRPAPLVVSAALVEQSARAPDSGNDDLVDRARQKLEVGDVRGARDLLNGHEDGDNAATTFALAETYDPNMLAAWDARGVEADAKKARELYNRALSLGVKRARARLDALR